MPSDSLRRLRLCTIATVALGIGCADPPAAPSDAPLTDRVRQGPLHVVRWNQFARSQIVSNRPSQFAAWRAMSYLTLAQAVAAHQQRSSASATAGAIAGASSAVLASIYPADSARITAEVDAIRETVTGAERTAFRAGYLAGLQVGARATQRAAADRFTAIWQGTVPVGPGLWFSSTVPPTPPVLPLLGQMRPFFLERGDQFRPGPPPPFGSPQFVDALAEVRRLSDARTPVQDSIAKFWALATGDLVSGYWNAIATDLIDRHNIRELRAAHILAVMNLSAMDALIACHDAKYTYWLLRPIQADPAITLAVGMPNFPAYPSNHACASGAATATLGAFLPSQRAHLNAMADQAGLSRVYGGIHYRFDSDVGLLMGRRIAQTAGMNGTIRELTEVLSRE